MLHRLILAQCSGFFEAGTSEDWSKAQAQAQGSGPGPSRGNTLGSIGENEEAGGDNNRPAHVGPPRERYRWRYELDRGNQDEEVPMLVQRVGICHYPTNILSNVTSRLRVRCSVETMLLNLHPYQTNLLHQPQAFSGRCQISPPCNLPPISRSPIIRTALIVTPSATTTIFFAFSIITLRRLTRSTSQNHIYNANLFSH